MRWKKNVCRDIGRFPDSGGGGRVEGSSVLIGCGTVCAGSYAEEVVVAVAGASTALAVVGCGGSSTA